MSEECHHCEDKWFGLATFLPSIEVGGGGYLFVPQSGHITYQRVSQLGEGKRPLSVYKSVGKKKYVYIKSTTVYFRSSELGLFDFQPLSGSLGPHGSME
jgi:hypothetical protein